jgi:hypothetical protein
MLGAILMFSSALISLWIWLVRIRSYVMRSGETPITGASWGVSAWADWQQCREFAKTHDDPRGLWLARSFIIWQLAFVVGLVLLLCGI